MDFPSDDPPILTGLEHMWHVHFITSRKDETCCNTPQKHLPMPRFIIIIITIIIIIIRYQRYHVYINLIVWIDSWMLRAILSSRVIWRQGDPCIDPPLQVTPQKKQGDNGNISESIISESSWNRSWTRWTNINDLHLWINNCVNNGLKKENFWCQQAQVLWQAAPAEAATSSATCATHFLWESHHNHLLSRFFITRKPWEFRMVFATSNANLKNRSGPGVLFGAEDRGLI